MQYSITFFIRPEAASNVICGVACGSRLDRYGCPVKCGDSRSNCSLNYKSCSLCDGWRQIGRESVQAFCLKTKKQYIANNCQHSTSYRTRNITLSHFSQTVGDKRKMSADGILAQLAEIGHRKSMRICVAVQQCDHRRSELLVVTKLGLKSFCLVTPRPV